MADAGRGPLWKAARRLVQRLRLARHRWQWDRVNRHNETSAVNQFDVTKVSVGRYSYGPLRIIDGANTSKLHVGAFCSIAEDVTFVLNGDHPVDRVTTFPLRAFVLREEERVGSRGDIVVSDDVWIGHGAIILSGVTLGRGSVIAAGAVVTRDVAEYSIVAGAPARHVRERVPPEVAARLRVLNLDRVDSAVVRAHLELLETSVSPLVLEALEVLDRAIGADEGSN